MWQQHSKISFRLLPRRKLFNNIRCCLTLPGTVSQPQKQQLFVSTTNVICLVPTSVANHFCSATTSPSRNISDVSHHHRRTLAVKSIRTVCHHKYIKKQQQQQQLPSSFSTMAEEIRHHPVQTSIENQLTSIFQPTYLQVINESHRHNVPKNSETHFKVVIVSETFMTTKNLIERHRMVNAALKEQLAGPVHALSIVAKTPQQWQEMVNNNNGAVTIEPSPNCQGGDGSLPRRT